jgi:hypothetical protein
VKRFASVAFDEVLGPGDRDAAWRWVRSVGAHVTSWSDAAERSYALLAVPADCLLSDQFSGARVDEPPLAVLRITPARALGVDALERALGGAGRPLGVVEARRAGSAFVVAVKPDVTSLGFLVALIETALAGHSGGTIEPLLPFDDAALTELAGSLLAEPRLDAQRLIETHLEPLLAGRTS